jgi:hypothetical protein
MTGSGSEVLPLWLSKGREGGESRWSEGEWMGKRGVLGQVIR